MFYIILLNILIILDQITKILAVKYLKGGNQVTIINNWLHLTYVENSGAAWGMMQNSTMFFVIITVIIIFAINFYLLREGNNVGTFFKIGLVIIEAGAIGNLIDRIRLGYVIDFLYSPLGGLYNFPVFNFADVYITCSAILLMIYILFFEGKDVK